MSDLKPSLHAPTSAKVLGFAGLIPFVGCMLAALLAGETLRPLALQALMAYAAVILSFLGGVHWGLAIAVPRRWDSDESLTSVRLAFSIVPSLIAWAALLMPLRFGMLVTSLAIALVLMLDQKAVREGTCPVWYLSLRLALSFGAVISLVVGASAIAGAG